MTPIIPTKENSMDAQWIDVSVALPLKHTLVLVNGWDPTAPEAGRAYAACRLVDSDDEGECFASAVWVDDATYDELVLRPTHWLALPDALMFRP